MKPALAPAFFMGGGHIGMSEDSGTIRAGGRGRRLAVVGGRPLKFNKDAKTIFLDHLASSCNVKAAATAAGVCQVTVYRHRAKDSVLREQWNAAIEQGYARLEARLLDMAEEALATPIDGDDARMPNDAMKILAQLRSHRPGEDKPIHGMGLRAQPVPMDVLADKLIGRLKRMGVRVRPCPGIAPTDAVAPENPIAPLDAVAPENDIALGDAIALGGPGVLP